MKEKIRNFLIITFYFTGIPLLRILIYKLLKIPLLRVIVFHQIKNNQIEDFKKKITLLKKKFNLLSPKDFLNKNFSAEKINILFTFDDYYRNWLSNLVPILEKENLSAIFFLDKRGVEIAGDISKRGFVVGSHTLNHPRLPELPPADLEKEIKESKRILEEKIGSEIIFFAYPFGDIESFNNSVIEEVKKTDYRYAFTILPGFNKKDTDSYLLHRDSLDVSWGNLLFSAWLYGSYDYFKKSVDNFKSKPDSFKK